MEKFELTDSQGVSHKYSVMLHPASAGVRLSVELVRLLGPTLLAFADVSVNGPIGDADVAEILSKIDMSTLSSAFAALEDVDSDRLLAQIFAQTARGGHGLTSGGALNETFNNAYRGNYLEMWQAAVKVVVLNNFLPLGSISAIR